MSLVSDRITKNIKPSPTLMTEARAAELREKGFPVISLGTGEPDFATPLHIREAAIAAMNNGYTKYTPSGGLKEIKSAIINKFKRENNIEYAFNEVCVNSGAKQNIYNALMVTLPRNEILFKCIRRIVKNVANKFYGNGFLEPTGPALLSNFVSTSDNIVDLKHSVLNDNNYKVIYFNDIPILKSYNNHIEEREKYSNKKHYSILWKERKIYL